MRDFFNFLKDLDSKPAIIILTILLCLSIFLTWQVTNHIPTQIKELKEDIKEDLKGVNLRLDNMDKRFDDIYKVLIEIRNK